MKPRVVGFPANLWPRVLLALLALGVFAPQKAEAGCSNHVSASSSLLSGASSPLDLANFQVELAETPNDDNNAPPSKSVPCSGVFCTGNSAPPSTTIPVVPPLGGGHWAIPAFSLPWDAPDSLAHPQVDAGFQPSEFSSSIFRPPR